MDTHFLDAEAEQLARGHEQNMPCRRAIGLALDRAKELVAENYFSSEEEALSHLRLCVKDLPAYKKRNPAEKAAPRKRKSGTKLRYK
jgi:hypothetical protein